AWAGPSWGWGGYYPPAYHRPAFIDRRHPGAGGNYGSTNPARPNAIATGRPGSGTNGGRHPGNVSSGVRPSAVGQGGNYNSGSLRGGLNSRPVGSQISTGRRPSTSNGVTYTPSTSRPGANSTNSNRTNGGRQTYNNNTNTNRTPSYSSPSRSSGSSFGGGRSSGGSFGGGGGRSSAGGRGRH
nr:hypothetical protein [Duncaniella sp.]